MKPTDLVPTTARDVATAQGLALVGPLAAVGSAAANALASGRPLTDPIVGRAMFGGTLAALFLSAISAASPSIGRGFGALLLVTAIWSFPWHIIGWVLDRLRSIRPA